MKKNEQYEPELINIAAEVGSIIDGLERCLESFNSGDKKKALTKLDEIEDELLTRAEKINEVPEQKKMEIEEDIKEARNQILWVINQMQEDCET